MKRTSTIALALLMALGAAACGVPPGAGAARQPAASSASPLVEPSSATNTSGKTGQTELVVFAAASMTETLEEIAGLYAKAEPDVKLVFNFDSSGTLKTQIQEGAECDLFISAGQKQMDQLDITAPYTVNTEKLDFVEAAARINLLENRVALVVPKGNLADIKSFGEMQAAILAGRILLAMGNSDVPVGQYTQKILKYFDLDEQSLAASGRISYGTNVKEVTTQVTEASVDCGIIYCTDAFSAGLDIVDYATADMCGRVVYPAAVLKTGKNPEAARAFLDYLTSGEAIAVFESVGFSKA